MKRFQSPLTPVLRLRHQQERMAQLQVSHARSEYNAAAARLADAQGFVDRQAADLERRLQQPGALLVIQQAQLELLETESIVRQLTDDRAAAGSRLSESVAAYKIAQQERDLVEKAVERHRDEHRLGNARAAAVDLQEWSLRPKSTSSVDAAS